MLSLVSRKELSGVALAVALSVAGMIGCAKSDQPVQSSDETKSEFTPKERIPKEVLKNSKFVSDKQQKKLAAELDGTEWTYTINKEVYRLIFYVTETGLHYSKVHYYDVEKPKDSDKIGAIYFWHCKFMEDSEGNSIIHLKSGPYVHVGEYVKDHEKIVLHYHNGNEVYSPSKKIKGVNWGKTLYEESYR